LMITKREDLGLGLPSLHTTLLDHTENQQLGGLEWDRTLARLVADKAMNEYDFEDPHLDARNKAILLGYCETAKRQLCRGNSSFFYTGLHGHQVEILPGEFQSAICDLVSRTGELLEKMLRKAEQSYGWLTEKRIQALTAQGVPRAKVEDKKVRLLLCGGLARMPMIKDCVGQVMGEPPLVDRTPELLVTVGTAYRAYLRGLDAQEKPPSVELILPQLTVLHVINIYRKLGLPVTNDGQLIEAKVKKLRVLYLRMKNDPDPKLREEANRWFKDVSLLQNSRPLLLSIVRQDFFQWARPMLELLAYSENERVPRSVYDALTQHARRVFGCDPQLAEEFAISSIKEIGRQVYDPAETIRTDYEPIRIQRFCEQCFDDAELRKFCLYLKQKLRRVYDYLKLAGVILAEKIISLIEVAEKKQ